MTEKNHTIEMSELVLSTLVTFLGDFEKLGYTGNSHKEILDWLETQELDSVLEGINNIIDEFIPRDTE